MRDYTLTESICDQAVIVSSKSHGWEEWFANPTAGPWKRIGIPGVSSLTQTGFEKEETRPDLILYNSKPDKKILIIESKDNIDKIIDSSNDNKQIKKTCEVFLNIKTRLVDLIKSSTEKNLSSEVNSINYIPGYVVGNSDDLSEKITKLKELHFQYVNQTVFSYFVLLIITKTNYDLSLEPKVISLDENEQIKNLQEFFQSGI